jgi:hypothetical protein
MTSNDEFRRELREALGYTDEVSDGLIEMIMTGYDIAGLDVIIAELTYDSLRDGGLVPVRGEEPIRMIAAEAHGVTLELEIVGQIPRLVGRVIPARTGTVHLDQGVAPRSVPLDEAGAFEFALGTGPFRVRFDPEDGEQIATEWLTHGSE